MMQALDQLVRIVLHEQPVLEGAGLGLVGVADDVLGARALARDEGPLGPAGEAGAAAAAQSGPLDLFDDLFRLHAQGLGEGVVAAALAITTDGQRFGPADVACEDAFGSHGHFRSRTICRTRSGVRFSW